MSEVFSLPGSSCQSAVISGTHSPTFPPPAPTLPDEPGPGPLVGPLGPEPGPPAPSPPEEDPAPSSPPQPASHEDATRVEARITAGVFMGCLRGVRMLAWQ